jgi:hypothetical protein
LILDLYHYIWLVYRDRTDKYRKNINISSWKDINKDIK